MKERFQKIMSYITLFIMLFTNPATMIFVNAESAQSSVTVGKLQNAGDIQVTKSVAPAPSGTAGEYEITFNVKSKAKSTTQPVYAVVVFDRSGSMICDPSQGEANYAKLETIFGKLEYKAADGTWIKCDKILPNRDAFTKTKWENAIQGAQIFNNKINEALGENAHVSLITFSSSSITNIFGISYNTHLGAVSEAQNFETASFGHPLGGTRLDLAIEAATNKLNTQAQSNSNAKKVMLIISDGEPNDKAAATAAANIAKNSTNKIEIYAIGYNTDNTASEYLKSIATKPANYSNANPTSIANKVEDMATEITSIAGSQIVEVPNSPAFTLKNEEVNDKLVVKSIDGDIITYEPITFKIIIDKTLGDGTYDTNNIQQTKILLGNNEEFIINKTPNVNWTRPSYSYTVNYYKDSISSGNLLKTETKTGKLSTPIEYDTNYAVEGYERTSVEGQTTVTENEDNNVLNVIYTKKTNLKLNVYYHYLGIENEIEDEVKEDTSSPYTVTFGDTVNVETYKTKGAKEGFSYNNHELTSETIVDGANRLDIYYVRGKYNYCVKYFYDNKETEESRKTGNEYFGKLITFEDKNEEGYEFVEFKPADRVNNNQFDIKVATDTNSIDPAENTVEAYYQRKTYNYTVEYYKDEISSTPVNTTNGSNKYNETITIDKKKAYDGYKFDHAENAAGTQIETPKLTENNMVIKVLYVKNNFNYTVNYYKDEVSGTPYDTTTNTGVYGNTIPFDKNRTDITGYKYHHAEDTTGNTIESANITSTATNNVINVVYKKKTNLSYTVTYHYQGIENEIADENVEDTNSPYTATFGDTIDVESFKTKGARDGFSYKTHNLSSETIIDGVNTLDIYYVRGKYNYCVKYYYDNVEDTNNKKTGNDYLGKIITFEDKNKTGYEFVEFKPTGRVSNKKFDIKVTSDTNTTEPTENTIEAYYQRKTYNYTVEYYKDQISGNPVDTTNGSDKYNEDIQFDKNKSYDGYKFHHAENASGNTETNPKLTENNMVIKVLYVKDDFNYTVNYYKDEVSEKPYDSTSSNGVYENTIPFDKNRTDITGYEYDHTEDVTGNTIESANITSTATNNVINVVYKKKTLNYTVEYYKDDISGNPIEVTNGSDKYDEEIPFDQNKDYQGYVFDHAENIQGEEITSAKIAENERNNVIKVLYVLSEYDYTIEYYYDGELKKELTYTATFGDEINEYDDLLEDGYELDKTSELPLVISDNVEDNVIKVYYKSTIKERMISKPETMVSKTNNIRLYILFIFNLLLSSLIIGEKKSIIKNEK